MPTRLSKQEYAQMGVPFTDGEWDRLETIKAEKEDLESMNLVSAAFLVDDEIKRKAVEYAESQGLTFSQFCRQILEGAVLDVPIIK